MSHEFCRAYLQEVRSDAAGNNISVPKKLTAYRSGKQWQIQWPGEVSEWFKADCAYEARAKFIERLIDKKIGKDFEGDL